MNDESAEWNAASMNPIQDMQEAFEMCKNDGRISTPVNFNGDPIPVWIDGESLLEYYTRWNAWALGKKVPKSMG